MLLLAAVLFSVKVLTDYRTIMASTTSPIGKEQVRSYLGWRKVRGGIFVFFVTILTGCIALYLLDQAIPHSQNDLTTIAILTYVTGSIFSALLGCSLKSFSNRILTPSEVIRFSVRLLYSFPIGIMIGFLIDKGAKINPMTLFTMAFLLGIAPCDYLLNLFLQGYRYLSSIFSSRSSSNIETGPAQVSINDLEEIQGMDKYTSRHLIAHRIFSRLHLIYTPTVEIAIKTGLPYDLISDYQCQAFISIRLTHGPDKISRQKLRTWCDLIDFLQNEIAVDSVLSSSKRFLDTFVAYLGLRDIEQLVHYLTVINTRVPTAMGGTQLSEKLSRILSQLRTTKV